MFIILSIFLGVLNKSNTNGSDSGIAYGSIENGALYGNGNGTPYISFNIISPLTFTNYEI